MKLERLQELARDLPSHAPDVERNQELRESLLGSLPEVSAARPRRAWLGAAAVAAVAALAFFVGTQMSSESAPAPELARAQLSAPDGTLFVRSPVVAGAEEEVRLSDGKLTVDARKSERSSLRVIVDDAQILGSAEFEVHARDGQLAQVVVHSGRAEVRMRDLGAVILGPGEDFRPVAVSEHLVLTKRALVPEEPERAAPPDTVIEAERSVLAADEPAVEAASSPARRRAAEHTLGAASEPAVEHGQLAAAVETHSSPMIDEDEQAKEPPLPTEAADSTKPQNNPAEAAFELGYRAVRRGDYQRAIDELPAVISSSDDPALRGDARYWLVVALGRAGKTRQALEMMESYLRHHERSARTGEVATMLGWQLVALGELDRAESLFKRGRDDASPAVQASAREGLEAIAKARR